MNNFFTKSSTSCRFHPFRTCLLFACAIAATATVHDAADAQQNYQQQPAPVEQRNAFEKFSDKVKGNMKQMFSGFGRKPDPAQVNGQVNQYPSQSRMPQQTSVYPNDRIAGSYRQAQYNSNMMNPHGAVQQASHLQSPQGYSDQPELPYLNPNLGPNPSQQAFQQPGPMNPTGFASQGQPLPARVDQPMPGLQNAPPYQPQVNAPQQRTMTPMLGEHYGARSGLMPSRMPTQSAQPLMQHPQPIIEPATATQQPVQHAVMPNAALRTGHFQNRQGIAQQQFNQQETATQRLLRLSAENRTLQETQQSLMAENNRLKQQLEKKNSLLRKIEQAIGDARKELQAANKRNASLKQQLAILIQEKEDQMRAAALQLKAIKARLDEMLTLELTSR